MVRMNVANMALGPELTLAALLGVNAAVMSGFNSRTATPEELQEFGRTVDVLRECCDALEASIAQSKRELAS